MVRLVATVRITCYQHATRGAAHAACAAVAPTVRTKPAAIGVLDPRRPRHNRLAYRKARVLPICAAWGTHNPIKCRYTTSLIHCTKVAKNCIANQGQTFYHSMRR